MFNKEKVVNKVLTISVDNIQPNPAQPRKSFDEIELKSLAESIRRSGVLQPLSVRKLGDRYELIAGERRLRASRLAGLEEVPCIVVDVTARESAILAVLENLQRQDLTFFEEARAYHSLIMDWDVTQEQAAEKLGKAQSTIANKLRLLRMTKEEEQLIVENSLTERHARALLRIENIEMRKKVLDNVIQRSFNVSQTEDLVDKVLQKDSKKKKQVPTILIKDIRIFFNTMDKAVDLMKKSGVDAKGVKVEHNDYIEYIVTIPKENNGRNSISKNSAI